MSGGRVVLWVQVPDDLEAVFQYLTERSPDAADRFIDKAEATLADLAEMPGKGSPKHYRGVLSGVRSWPIQGFRNYLVLYRPVAGGIEVLAVVHGARRLSHLLRERYKGRYPAT